MIGEVPLPVVKEDRRSGLRAAAEANVPGLVAAERGGRERREELLARIATAHRSAPPPEVPYRQSSAHIAQNPTGICTSSPSF